MADLGEGPGEPAPLILGKEKKKWSKREKTAGQVNQHPSPPPLTLAQVLDLPLAGLNLAWLEQLETFRLSEFLTFCSICWKSAFVIIVEDIFRSSINVDDISP